MLASPAGTWRPERVYPPATAEFAELRRRLHLPERPTLACVTIRAHLRPDPSCPPRERDRSHHQSCSRRASGESARPRPKSSRPTAATQSTCNSACRPSVSGALADRHRGRADAVRLTRRPPAWSMSCSSPSRHYWRAEPARGDWRSWREPSCSRIWYANRASFRCGDRQTISSSATHCVKSGQRSKPLRSRRRIVRAWCFSRSRSSGSASSSTGQSDGPTPSRPTSLRPGGGRSDQRRRVEARTAGHRMAPEGDDDTNGLPERRDGC